MMLSNVRIELAPVGAMCRVVVDGQEQPDVRAFELRAAVDESTELTLHKVSVGGLAVGEAAVREMVRQRRAPAKRSIPMTSVCCLNGSWL